MSKLLDLSPLRHTVNIVMNQHSNLKEYLGGIEYSDDLGSKTESHLFGVAQSVEATLKYSVKDEQGKEKDKGEYNFYIVAKDDCNDIDTPPPGPPSGNINN